jgi:uncharacterized protein HemX
MKNNEWNVPSNYFEKNKKALMPVRKFPTGKWLLALAAACFVGLGLFMWKGENQVQEVAKVEEKNEKQNENENEGKKGEEKVREGKNEKQNENEEKRVEDVGAKYLSPRIAEELKEIPKEELVEYLLDEDSDFIENLN